MLLSEWEFVRSRDAQQMQTFLHPPLSDLALSDLALPDPVWFDLALLDPARFDRVLFDQDLWLTKQWHFK